VPTTDIITTTIVAIETIAEVKSVSGVSTARIHREESAEQAVGEVPVSWQGVALRSATSSDYWLIVTGNRVYRQDNRPDVSDLNEALLEFVFPLRVGDEWYVSDAKARLVPTPIPDDFLLRQVKEIGDVVVPAGHFNNCFLMREKWAGTSFATWFCPQIGIVERAVDHQGTPEGFHEVLVKYQLNK
jgi:hypothetical protein